MSDFKKYLNKYVFDCTFPGSGKKIEFKPITTGQMKELLAHENETNPHKIEDILDALIEECVTDDKFDVKSLYIQDRFFLLIEIRKYTKGTKYQFEFTCPQCSSQSIQTTDLNKLKVTKLKSKKKTRTVNLSEDISIKMAYPTRQNQIEAFGLLNSEEFSTGQAQADLGLTLTAATIRAIVTPDGVQTDASLEDKVFLLENIPPEQYEKIGEGKDFGVDFTVNINCANCEYSRVTPIPPENFFF